MTNKLIFNNQNFQLTNENFSRWYKVHKCHLITLDIIEFINDEIDLEEIDGNELKQDWVTQSIIEKQLDTTTAELIWIFFLIFPLWEGYIQSYWLIYVY